MADERERDPVADEQLLDALTQLSADLGGKRPKPLNAYLGGITDPEVQCRIASEYLTAARPRDAAVHGNPRYHFLEELGAGGQGTVWRARDLERDEDVAIKQVATVRLQDRRRFEREASIGIQLRHDALCPVLDKWTHGDLSYLVMKLLPEPTLKEKLERAVKAADETPAGSVRVLGGGTAESNRWLVGMLEELARALSHVHRHGLVHRDVKPENIKVSATGHPILFDFGIAHSHDSSITESRQQPGTPRAKSPEQIRGERVDGTADVFSLGSVLYECLTLRHPFEAHSVTETERRILESVPDPVPPRQGLRTDDLRRVVRAALEKSTSMRYETAAAFAEDLRRLRVGEPPLAKTPSAWQRFHQLVDRNRGLFLGLGVAIAVLVAGLVAFAIQWQRAETSAELAIAQSDRADREATTATHQAQRAEDAKQAAQQAGAIAQFNEGLLAARLGQWDHALSLYNASMQHHPRHGEVRLRMVEALEASARIEEAVQQLELLKSEGAGDLIAQVLLIEADLGVDRWERWDAGLDLVQAALAFRGERALPTPQRRLAEALVATDLVEAIEHVARAHQADPYDRRIVQYYLDALLLAGRQAEALALARSRLALQPDDPTSLRALAFLLAFQSEPSNIDELAMFGELTPDQRVLMDRTRNFAKQVRDLQSYCFDLMDPSTSLWTIAGLFMKAGTAFTLFESSKANGSGPDSGLSFRTLPAFQRTLADLVQPTALEVLSRDPRQLADELATAGRSLGEASILCFAGLVLSIEEPQRAIAEFDEAANLTSLMVPDGAAESLALHAALKQSPPTQAAARDAFHVDLRHRVAQRLTKPVHATVEWTTLWDAAMRSDVSGDLPHRVASAWTTQEPGSADAKVALSDALVRLEEEAGAMRLLEEVLREQPGHPAAKARWDSQPPP